MAGQRKDYKPPHLWGVLPWKLENGMTPELAGAIITAYVLKTHDREQAAHILNVGEGAIGVFMRTPASIPAHVGRRIDTLAKVLRKNPARTKEIFKQVESTKAHIYE